MSGLVRRAAAPLARAAITSFARLLTGVRARWVGCGPSEAPRVYFPNHASHVDFVLVWSSLPPALRALTRPVAGSDYWERAGLRAFLIHDVFRGVLVDREAGARAGDPLAPLEAALAAGSSLIFFPEGTRNTTAAPLLPFKSGLFHLARRRPEVELVPVWIENLARVLPKGEVLPVPLLCTVDFGEPLRVGGEEPKAAFLERARAALLDLGVRAGHRPSLPEAPLP